MIPVALATRTRILTADDHPLLRDGIAAMIALEPDMEVVGEASDAEEAVARFRSLRPDVTLMDLSMPGAAAWRRWARSGGSIRRPGWSS